MFLSKDTITTQWFFSEPPAIFKYLGIYVKGDAFVLIPFLVCLLILLILSLKLGLIVAGLYIAVRGLGEMIYWLFQQFGPKTYRPPDYGFKKLNNEAVYIIYQVRSMINVIVGSTLIIAVILYLK